MDVEQSDAQRSDTAAQEPAAPAAPSPWLALTIVCLAQFMIVLDATVVNVAAPSIQKSLHFSSSGLQWVINAYTLMAGGFLLLGGRAGDLVGRRRIFQLGMVLFTAASLFNGLAGSDTALIIGRGLQGVGAALASPAALSVLLTTFPEARDRTKALAVWSTIAVTGGAVGVLLGGVLTNWLSWRWIFFINVPIGLLTLLASWRYVAESRAAARGRRFDLAGALTVTAGTVLLVYAVVQAPTWTWGSAKTIGTGLAALVLLAVFVGVELRSQDPLVRMSIFRIRSLSVGNGALMLLGGASYALFLFASLYVQEIMGYSPMRGGLAFMPVFAGSVVGAVLAQRLILLIGTRAVSVIGLALSAGGMLLLLNLPVHGTYNGDLLGQLSVLSIGLGMSTVPLTLLSTSGVPAELSGLASGVNNMSQNVGRSLGLAVLTTVEVTHARDATHGTSPAALLSGQVAGFHAGFLGSAILLAAAIVLILALLRAKHTRAIDEGARSKKKPAGTADAVPTAG